MDTIDQYTALVESATGPADMTRYWRADGFGGIECLAAHFRRHRYVPHTHDSYAIGTILEGCETFVVRGERRYAAAGDLCFVNPGEVHDGEPRGAGYAYRMSYPSVALLQDVASEMAGRAVRETPCFAEPVVHDPQTARRFSEAHRALDGGTRLAGDEMFIGALAAILLRHADNAAIGRLGREPGPVARARDYLDAHFREDVDLATLARVSGLSRFHLLRAFRRETGLTPRAWLTDRRAREARRMLSLGVRPGEVAAACGFADQSHLTRVFKARVGVTPGRFSEAHRRDAA